MIKIIAYLFILIWHFCLPAVEYAYPVGADNTSLYLIKQTDQKKLELYKKGIHEGAFKKETYSFNQEMLYDYSVANFQLLPDNSGYSFIDNGRLRIKFRTKPSPVSVDFLYPLYDLHSIVWLSDTDGIICAKYKNCFGLFHFAIDGRVEPLIWTGSSDFLYPQKVDKYIFCIKKALDQSLSNVIRFDCDKPHMYLEAWDDLSFDKQVAILMRKKCDTINSRLPRIESIISTRHIVCLSMININCGLYITHTGETNFVFNFSCHILLNKRGKWQNKKLFNFCIPRYLLLESSEKRVVEKIRLLLPMIHKNRVYFTDSCGKQNTLGLFYYDLFTDKINKKQIKEGALYFCCQCANNNLYFGGIAKN